MILPPILLLYNYREGEEGKYDAELERQGAAFAKEHGCAFEAKNMKTLRSQEALELIEQHAAEGIPENPSSLPVAEEEIEEAEVEVAAAAELPPSVSLKPATSFQENTLREGGVCTLAACVLWIAGAFGVLTPGVLGTSAIATALIAAAWPLTVGLGVLGVGMLLSVGIYSYCARESAGGDDKFRATVRPPYRVSR